MGQDRLRQPGKGRTRVDKALSRIGGLMKPIKQRMEALAATIVDNGPTPELALLGQRMQDARDAAGGGRTRPATKTEEMRQAEKAHGRLQRLLLPSKCCSISGSG